MIVRSDDRADECDCNVSATNSSLLSALTARQWRFFSELLLRPLRHKIGSDIDERFGDLGSILTGRFPFCLAELADGRDDIPSDGMTSKDGLPKLGCVPCSQQKAEVPIEGIKGLIIDPGKSGPMVFRRFGEACRYPVVFRNDGLDGSMLGCFHRQVQGIRASQLRDPLTRVDKPRADDESREIAVEAAHRPDRRDWTACPDKRLERLVIELRSCRSPLAVLCHAARRS